MGGVVENWERLVRAVLRREQLRSTGQGVGRRLPSAVGIAGVVPPSLAGTSNIDSILQLANEVEVEDPMVARILCEQAYGMAQKLDPTSEGRGVVQFKTGLLSVIKQKGQRVDRERAIEHLWNFYQSYKRQHNVDDVQKEQQRLSESGTFDSSFGRMKKVYATLRVLIDVLEAIVGDAYSDRVGRQIMEEVRRVKKTDVTFGDLTPYNIVPLDAPSLANAIGFFPEVKAAISAIAYPTEFCNLPGNLEVPKSRGVDMLDLLEYVFGFQKDNVRNQRENVVLILANTQSRYGGLVNSDPEIDGKVIVEVFTKVLDNYIKWCKYLGFRVAWNRYS